MKRKFTLMKIDKKNAAQCRELYTVKYESDLDVSRGLPIGQEVACNATDRAVRNQGLHRKMFALLSVAFTNLPEQYEHLFKNVEEFREEVKLQIGSRERRVSMSGREYWLPKSWAFDRMPQSEFEEVYDKVLTFVCEFILPGVDNAEIERQILEFL